MFCEYKNLFGEPGKGIHSFRLFHISVVDVMVVVLLAYGIYTQQQTYSFGVILMGLFLLGVVVHYMVCVRTQVSKWLGL